MQFTRNIAPAVLAAFCLALAVAGCGQKDNSATPPAGTPTVPNTMPPDEQAALHAQGSAAKPH